MTAQRTTDFDYDLENTLAADERWSELLAYAWDRQIIQRLVQKWITAQRRKGFTVLETEEELYGPAFEGVEKRIRRFKPFRGSLYRYLKMPVYEALNIWRGEQLSPVGLPQKVARALRTDLRDESFHRETSPVKLEDIAQ